MGGSVDMRWLRGKPAGASLYLVVAVAGLLLELAHLLHGRVQVSLSPMIVERLMCAALVAVVALHGLIGVPALGRAARRGATVWAGAALVLAALGLRLLVEPVFLHAEFLGLKYLETSLSLERSLSFGGSYGQAGFLVQGLLHSLLGGTLGSFFVANILAGAGAIALGAAIVHRWAGDLRATALFIVLAGLNPVLIRTTASEDVHVIGVLFAFAAIYCVEAYRESGRQSHLYCAVAAAVLAICVRQHLLLLLPLVFPLYLGERLGWRFLASGAGRRAVAGFVLGLVVKLGFIVSLVVGISDRGPSGFLPDDVGLADFAGLLALFSWSSLTAPHPLLDPGIALAPTTVLLVAALFGLRSRSRRLPRSIALFWLLLFLLSMLSSGFGDQATYLFSAVLMYVSVLLAAMGWVSLSGWMTSAGRGSSRMVNGAFWACILLAFIAVPRIVLDSPQDPFSRQVFFIDAVAESLPEDFTLVSVGQDDTGPTGCFMDFPRFLLEEHGRRVDYVGVDDWLSGAGRASRPVLFFRGAQCHAVTVFELFPDGLAPGLPGRLAAGQARSFLTLLRGQPGESVMREKRAPCFALDDQIEIRDEWSLTVSPEGLAPSFLFYERTPFRVGFFPVQAGDDEGAGTTEW